MREETKAETRFLGLRDETKTTSQFRLVQSIFEKRTRPPSRHKEYLLLPSFTFLKL